MTKRIIPLGAKVRDRISGFTGIAVVKLSFINGCDRYSLQGTVNKDNEIPETETFDEPDLEILELPLVKKLEAKEEKSPPGGPHRPFKLRRY